MTEAATAADQPVETGPAPLLYEQPLNERMRTFLRIEFLFRQVRFLAEEQSPWSSRGAVTSLLDIVAILSRGDVRGDVLKELERQLYTLDRLTRTDDVDSGRLRDVVSNLKDLRGTLNAVGPKYLQELRDSEFLNAIRHRSSIPGGTCAFDIPEYTHWLRQDFERRLSDIHGWFAIIEPLCNCVDALLWLVRNSRQPTRQLAPNGVYQHSMNRDSMSSLIRVTLPGDSAVYPEISGGQHRFSVRMMEWKPGQRKPTQARHDVEFELAVC